MDYPGALLDDEGLGSGFSSMGSQEAKIDTGWRYGFGS